MKSLFSAFILGIVLTTPLVNLSLISPSSNQIVSGTTTFVSVADGNGINSIQFKIDGVNFGSLITSGPCYLSVDTNKLTNGIHSAQVIGTDINNVAINSPIVSFTVNNVVAPPPPQNTLVISGTSIANTELTYTLTYSGITSYVVTLTNSAGVIVVNSTRALDGTSPDIGLIGLGNFPAGNYVLKVTSGSLSNSSNVVISSTPIPTPIPADNTEVLSAITGLATTISSDINQFKSSVDVNFQSLINSSGVLSTASLNAIQQIVRQELSLSQVPPVPQTCDIKVTTILAPYPDGDYRVVFKFNKTCAIPVTNAIWKSLNIK